MTIYTWFTGAITNAHYSDNLLMICTKNEFSRDWLEMRYDNLIRETLTNILNKEVKIKYVLEE
ncbi:DnaA N-terminal domain-containing protein [Peribacillus tepidiphilus]|uniref:DnaA N-terminal domain-containing protein n=1 Tax=Peribacillus tepidiphilus TaxID=2652445 RepID=UPI0035B54615